jgi:MFS family permease
MGSPRADLVLLFSSRALRLFGYGFLSVNLVIYLTGLGLSGAMVGVMLSLALLGDVVLSLMITTSADRLGRRRMLVLSAVLIIFAGIVLASTRQAWLIGAAALLGVLSPSGYEVGPFLSIEQASLTQLVPDRQRTRLFAWYNLVGSLATALGALVSGLLVSALVASGAARPQAYRSTVIGYAVVGVALVLVFVALSRAVEAPPSPPTAGRRLGLHRSRGAVARLSGLFALDAFAGAFLIQSLLAYWLTLRYAVPPAALGGIFFAANLLAGFSGLIAGRLAQRFGLINTMVFTHLPSNILLLLVPLMPSLSTTVAMLLLRFSISQMDVPTRQSYTMAVVSPDERSAAAGVTTTARSVGALLSPTMSAQLMAIPALMGVPFFIAGGLKIVYDVLLYRGFRSVKPPEETPVRDPQQQGSPGL